MTALGMARTLGWRGGVACVVVALAAWGILLLT